MYDKTADFACKDNFRTLRALLSKNLNGSLSKCNVQLWNLILVKLRKIQSQKTKKDDLSSLRTHGVEQQELEDQICELEFERQDLLAKLTAFNSEPIRTSYDPSGESRRGDLDKKKDEMPNVPNGCNKTLTNYLKLSTEKPDACLDNFIDAFLENHLLPETLSKYKTHRLATFFNNCDLLSEALYAKDFCSTPRKMWTSFYVYNTWKVPTKSMNVNKKSSRPAINANYIETLHDLLLPQTCNPESYYDRGGERPFLKYKSNKYFDNVSMSPLSLNILYNSYRKNCPKIILILKSLEKLYVEEIDNFEEVVTENIYDLYINTLLDIGANMNEDIMIFLEPKSDESVVSALRDRLDRSGTKGDRRKGPNGQSVVDGVTDNVQDALSRHQLDEGQLLNFGHKIDSVFLEIYENQMRFLEFADYGDTEKILVFSDNRIQLKDEKNPNVKIMRRINR